MFEGLNIGSDEWLAERKAYLDRFKETMDALSRPIVYEKRQDNEYSALRPTTFASFIGQASAVKRVKHAIKVAQLHGGELHHMAFVSEAGSGKTALVSCIANEMNCKAFQTVGSVLVNMDKVNDICEEIDGGIMFIDEAHDLQKGVIPGLLKLLEDFIMYTSYSSFVVKHFCCIMATNRIGELDEALRSRLGIPIEFAPYTEQDMIEIAKLRAKELDIGIKDESALLIAQRSRGNPRYCGHLVRECYNEAKLAGEFVIIPIHCHATFELLGISASGLNFKDVKLLERLIQGPMSVSLCQTYMAMDAKTFQALHETFLLREGYISISSRGRSITPKGIETTKSITNEL